MNRTLICIALLSTLATGCKLASVIEESAAPRHRHDTSDEPVPRNVRLDERVPEPISSHPRLLFTDAEIPGINAAIRRDPILTEKFDLLLHEGEKMLSQEPAIYVKDNEKALEQSRVVLSRVGTLAGLYRITGERRFADRARREMLAAADFPDWHPADFLATAELLNAMGIGYDWLYRYLSPRDRDVIYQAILSKGLRPAQAAYKHDIDWTHAESNHNQVGNGGVAVAAVSIADEDPKLARDLLDATRHSLPPAMNKYGPDGGWPEGPIYWDYATKYATFYLAALETGVGTDFGVSNYPGLSETGMFRIHSTGPTKKTFNFGDAEEQVHPAPFMFYLARHFKKPIYAAHEQYVSLAEANIFEVIWRARFGPTESFERTAEKTLPRDAIFRGTEVAFLRGDWEDPDATWVGFKGGNNSGTHRHLDLGSFVMDALGQRWASDLGPDDYGLPGYNGSDRRWTYYRTKTEGHNTITINAGNQSTDGEAPLMAFHSDPNRSYAVVDLTRAYARGEHVIRGIALLNRRDVVVIDEVQLGLPSRVTWNFHTRARVTVDGSEATLRLSGKTLHARILSPAGAKFEVLPASPPPPEAQNPDMSNLIVHLPALVTHTRIEVLLSPDPNSGEVLLGESARRESPARAPKLEPLEDWIADGPIRRR